MLNSTKLWQSQGTEGVKYRKRENSKITIECHNLLKLSVLWPLNHFSFLTQNLLNPFNTYRVTATRLEKSIILTHMWFQEMVCFDYILDMYAQFCA